VGDLLLAEWMTQNLPVLKKRALTPLRNAANTHASDRKIEDVK